jgi:hypothetical protein
LKSDYVTVGWNMSGIRSSVGFTANWRGEASPRDDSLNRDSIGAGFKVSRTFNPQLSVDFSSDFRREEFGAASVKSNEWSTGLGASWFFVPALGLRASWSHLTGSGDTSLGDDTRDYSENRYSVRLTWSPSR